MTSRGSIQPGYRHIRECDTFHISFPILTGPDILNRCRYISQSPEANPSIQRKNDTNTVKIMMYMFPRQFGLHNAFTSQVDPRTTVQKFQDYTIRDEEISRHLQSDRNAIAGGIPKIPKRLRGIARDLVRRLQIRHQRCSYFELIRHYCPSLLDELKNAAPKVKAIASAKPVAGQDRGAAAPNQTSTTARRLTQTQNRTQTSRVYQIDPSVPIVDLATPISHVSTLLQAVLSKIIPDAFLGEGDDLEHNKALLGKRVHHFVALRRFESMNLHELSQGFKVNSTVLNRTVTR